MHRFIGILNYSFNRRNASPGTRILSTLRSEAFSDGRRSAGSISFREHAAMTARERPSPGKRLIKSPKVYWGDSGLASQRECPETENAQLRARHRRSHRPKHGSVNPCSEVDERYIDAFLLLA